MQGASRRQVLTRMLNNLRGIYQRLGDGERELAVLEKLGILNPKDERVAESIASLRKQGSGDGGSLN
jgi:regulator of sirC expression with transglutaminase-like and TPR domain